METLASLFAHPALPRLLRLFLLNPQHSFLPKDISSRTKLVPATLRSGLGTIEKSGVIRRWGVGKKEYRLDPDFPYIEPFAALLVHPRTLSREMILKKLSGAGTMRMVVLAGVFVNEDTNGADILIVSDRLDERALETALAGIEAELGKELHYAAMSTKEFKYRTQMFDKLVRVIFEGRHEKLVDRVTG